ncbi:hypothetical protein KDA_72550 [Dictyobacter alpinus]|uniref:CHRD domain-containing protein n=1 Tax=Dictyobacter alpinus TaxID=2014873 RepID=A0A402BK99_9CHLR|nr:CHRD domain-containing protein [Dictyobacter alpinus]GCE31771.1 hypothetical protein KDA_72550 [Dictyobacter alpinus]
MLKQARLKSTLIRSMFIILTFCMLILTTAFVSFGVYARGATAARLPDPPTTPVATETTSATGTATGTGTATTTVTAQAVMQHTPNGVIRMTYNANDKTLTLNPSMSGFKPNSTHPVKIEQASCRTAGVGGGTATATGATPTEKATVSGTTAHVSSTSTSTPNQYSTTLTVDSTGHLKNSATIYNVSAAPSAPNMRVTVYNGPGLQTAEEKVAIACGAIKPYTPAAATATATNTGTATVTNTGTATAVSTATETATATSTATAGSGTMFSADMGPTDNPNERASGTAQLSLSDGTLTVEMNVRGLAPNSTHDAHLHSGTCKNIGNVVYDLGTLTATSQGTASLTKTFKNVTSIPENDLAAQVHYGTNLNDQAQYNPIMCGNVRINQNQSTTP